VVTLRVTINVETADGVKFTLAYEPPDMPRSTEGVEALESGTGVVLIRPTTSILPPGLALPISSNWSAATPS